jgi:hypothetical protein
MTLWTEQLDGADQQTRDDAVTAAAYAIEELFPRTAFTLTGTPALTWTDGPTIGRIAAGWRTLPSGSFPVSWQITETRVLRDSRHVVLTLDRRLRPVTAARLALHLLRAGMLVDDLPAMLPVASIPAGLHRLEDRATVRMILDQYRAPVTPADLPAAVTDVIRDLGGPALLEASGYATAA